ncbi:MAG TPA: MBL fold metallo-hydrolase [Acidimicrobiales bacterium]|nr:MBL fold metallo-hydrolase [Acidimicrobiales bacterium]
MAELPPDRPTRPDTATFSLTVLGCDGSWPGPGGAGSGYLVVSDGCRVLLDAGPGTFANLQRVIDPASLDAVIISHHHPDHWTDLHGVATHARFALARESLPVYAPASLAERTDLSGSPGLDWHLVTGGDTVTIGALTCSFHRTDHVDETLAVRIDGGGRSLGYSADTGPAWSLAEFGRGLDLVLAEATYTVDHEGTAGHMSGRQAGEQARRAGAERLVITHRWPTIDADAVAREATTAFGRPVEQAAIGKEFVL